MSVKQQRRNLQEGKRTGGNLDGEEEMGVGGEGGRWGGRGRRGKRGW